MDKLASKLNDRLERKAKKRDDKRRMLAESTAHALSVLGYANTSLRDIAEHSGNALGTLHYYFEDRVDLITYTVRLYKSAFLDELSAAARDSGSLDEVITCLSDGLANGATFHMDEHRLWFDIRNQTMFDPAFADAINEIEADIISVFQEIEQRFLGDRDGAVLDYAAIDGLFRHIMQSDLPEHNDYDANVALFKKMFSFLYGCQ